MTIKLSILTHTELISVYSTKNAMRNRLDTHSDPVSDFYNGNVTNTNEFQFQLAKLTCKNNKLKLYTFCGHDACQY